jgi:uncharacterized SAM-binding protein YcdF (DUF218 family)
VKKILLIFKKILIAMGVVLLFSVIMSFTDYPFWAYFWLGTHNSELETEPDVLVLLGGGGMPSPDGLMRCYSAAELAEEYPETRIVIAIPGDTAMHEKSPEIMMANELILRKTDSTRISFENEGYNTRTQALNVMEMIGQNKTDTLAIQLITSPDHMFRAVAAFRKLGFLHVGGRPVFEKDLDEKLLIRKGLSKKQYKAETRRLGLRYNMWNYMKYEITVLREWCAIAYYKLRGWI